MLDFPTTVSPRCQPAVEAAREAKILTIQPWHRFGEHGFDATDEAENFAELRRRYSEIAETLPKKWRRVLDLRMTGMTLEEIGDALGLTRERVRQIQAKAIDELRGVLAAA